MKMTAIALACLLGGVQGWAEDMELAAAHSSLPSTWRICKVFTLKNLYTSDRLYTTSRREAEVVRKIPIRIKQRLGLFEIGIGAAVSWYAPNTGRKFFKTMTEGSERRQYQEELDRGWFYPQNYDPEYMGPVYRLFNQHHFYTMCATECENVKTRHGWSDEGIAGYLVRADRIDAFRSRYQVPAGEPWHRLFHVDHNDHFYTTDPQEAKDASGRHGFIDEGVLGYLH